MVPSGQLEEGVVHGTQWSVGGGVVHGTQWSVGGVVHGTLWSVEGNLLSTYLEWDTKSVLIFRGTYVRTYMLSEVRTYIHTCYQGRPACVHTYTRTELGVSRCKY